ncbi:hypothetical protein COTS27_01309 [Spirochaetota bacterium]|nr:hypothetical protein COTS27_01309 [Spirochaetota bacterium]
MPAPSFSFIRPFILSPSGWRKVFLPLRSPYHPFKLEHADNRQVILAALTFAHYFKSLLSHKNHKILIARDSRASGAAIHANLLFILKEKAIPTISLGITSLPEMLACVKAEISLQGWLYITASHNPKEHNGFKLGGRTGQVLSSKIAHRVIARYLRTKTQAQQTYFHDTDTLIKNFLQKFSKQKTLDREINLTWQKKTRTHYEKSVQRLIIPNIMSHHRSAKKSSTALHKSSQHRQSTFQSNLKHLPSHVNQAHFSILINYNGSARITSAERTILKNWGVSVYTLNTTPGLFNDGIVPEGRSLTTLKNKLRSYHKKTLPLRSKTPHSQTKSRPILGIQYDADGDRGNLVTIAPFTQQVHVLGAQLTFALALLARVALIKAYFPHIKPAVIANGATSLLVRDIANASGVHYVQSETGESNVLDRSNQVAHQGYYIALAGEGSNGGNIVPPGTVRDPLTLMLSLIELLFLNPLKHTVTSAIRTPISTELDLAFSPHSPLSIAFEILAKIHNSSVKSLRLPSKTIPSAKITAKKPAKSFPFPPHILLHTLITWLNKYVTTEVTDPTTLIRLPSQQTKNLPSLKKYYTKHLTTYFKANETLFNKKFGIYKLTFALHLGIKTQVIATSNAIPITEKGGFSVYLSDRTDNIIGFLWFRTSQTEPVLRTLVEFSIAHVQKHLNLPPPPYKLRSKTKTTTQKLVTDLLKMHHKFIRKAAKRI